MLDFGPQKEQEAKEYQHWSIGNINDIYQRIAFPHDFLDLGSVEYARNPENDGNHKAKKYYDGAGYCKDHFGGFSLSLSAMES